MAQMSLEGLNWGEGGVEFPLTSHVSFQAWLVKGGMWTHGPSTHTPTHPTQSPNHTTTHPWTPSTSHFPTHPLVSIIPVLILLQPPMHLPTHTPTHPSTYPSSHPPTQPPIHVPQSPIHPPTNPTYYPFPHPPLGPNNPCPIPTPTTNIPTHPTT